MTKNETPKERPILFSAPMVKAILAGSKTQTRRIIKPQPSTQWMLKGSLHYEGMPYARTWPDHAAMWRDYYIHWHKEGQAHHHKALWIKHPDLNNNTEIKCPYGQPGDRLWVRETWLENAFGEKLYRADCEGEEDKGRGWKSPRFMPRLASRLLLEVVSVRVERLQEITEEDIRAEGAVARIHDDPYFGKMPISAFDGKACMDLRSLWAAGWDKINGKTAPWASNPFVWCVEFKRVQP